jgi:hypothetical protein
MDDPKYLVIDTYRAGPAIFLFPCFIPHDVMAMRLRNEGDEVLSGGFVQLFVSHGYPHCYGESVSLKLKSRPEDNSILLRQLGYE